MTLETNEHAETSSIELLIAMQKLIGAAFHECSQGVPLTSLESFNGSPSLTPLLNLQQYLALCTEIGVPCAPSTEEVYEKGLIAPTRLQNPQTEIVAKVGHYRIVRTTQKIG